MKRKMVKLLAILVVLGMVLCLAACEKSKVDENQRVLKQLQDGVEQAEREAERARREYDQLQKDWAEYERLLGALGGGK